MLCLYYYAHITEKARVGASSVSSDPNNDKDQEGNNPNTPKTKDSKPQNTGNNQSKQGKGLQNQSKQKDESKSRKKKIDTLGGYAGVPVGKTTPDFFPPELILYKINPSRG